MTTYSKCTRCAAVKPVDDFHRLRITNGRREYNDACKVCVNTGIAVPPSQDIIKAKGLETRQKCCPTCKITKIGSEFGYRNVGKSVCLASSCRACREKLQRDDRINPIKRLYDSARTRAKKLGIPFTIQKADLIVPSVCPALGIPLFIAGGKRTDNSPTVDRVVPDGPYSKENVRVISWKANRLKTNMTEEELTALLTYVKSCHLTLDFVSISDYQGHSRK